MFQLNFLVMQNGEYSTYFSTNQLPVFCLNNKKTGKTRFKKVSVSIHIAFGRALLCNSPVTHQRSCRNIKNTKPLTLCLYVVCITCTVSDRVPKPLRIFPNKQGDAWKYGLALSTLDEDTKVMQVLWKLGDCRRDRPCYKSFLMGVGKSRWTELLEIIFH